MFPFLIGRIRTKNETRSTIIGSSFPFLIGRIRTITGLLFTISMSSFHSS